MEIVLPNQVFFKPTKAGLKFLIKHFKCTETVIEVGCGKGDLCKALKEGGVEIMGIDLYAREKQSFPVLHIDATKFPYPIGSKVIIARPNRGDWYLEVVKTALESGVKEVIYIGIDKHIGEDIEYLCDFDFRVKKLLSNAGEDGEQIWSIKGESEMKKTKYYLITWGHGDLEMGPGWFKKLGGWWVNTSGGKMPITDKEKVLRDAEVEDSYDLDWEPVLIKPGAGAGWLDRKGNFWECTTEDHDRVAELVLRKSVEELEKTGWVRVDYSPEVVCRVPEQGDGWRLSYNFHGGLTAEQRNWLLNKGYVVGDNE